MALRPAMIVVLVVLVSAGVAGAAASGVDDGVVRQGSGGSGDGGMDGDGSGDGGMDGRSDGRPGPGTVSVDHRRPGNASVHVRNAPANGTVRVRFSRGVGSPETGIRVREMAMRTGAGNFSLGVHVATRVSAGVDEFPHAPAFGYLNVTHSMPNANVTNASMTFALNRTRLRERNVSADGVTLYRYRSTNRTWRRLETRVTERNRTAVTYRAESPGLSEFVVAPAVETATPTDAPDRTATATPTESAEPTATPPPTGSPTEGGGPGFGVLAAVVALLGVGWLARRN